ncbi:unnamed protein product, partial [Prorocentrum cordatum]
VMELCAGVVMERLLPPGSSLGGPGRHAVLRALLDAAVYLHGQLVAHRDLHARNVLIDSHAREGGAREGVGAVKVVDFGCALRPEGKGAGQGPIFEDDLNSSILPPEFGSDDSCPFACDVFAVGLLAAGLKVGQPLGTADVLRRGAVSVPPGFLALGAAGAAHMGSMLCPRPAGRPPARACLDALPPVEGWLA